jgi:23S rRNA (uracil1939-C5)-methyltransferase
MYNKAKRIVLVPEKWANGGLALAHVEGKVVFLEGGIPGEKAEFEIFQEKKDFAKARIRAVIEPVNSRVKPKCSHYGLCGGCDFQHLSHDAQILAKESIARDLFKKFAGIALPADFKTISGSAWAYRNRVRFKIQGGRLGFNAAGTNRQIPVQECPILVSGLLTQTLKFLESYPFAEGEISCFGNEASWSFKAGKSRALRTIDSLMIKGHKFDLHAGVFFQSNLGLIEPLIDYVIHDYSGALAVDLYAGVGLFSSFLEDRFERTLAVELNPDCLEMARKNLNKTEFVTEDAANWLQSFNETPDLLVVDPPRVGLSPEALQGILQLKPKSLVYVSCDPQTLARDLKYLLVNYDLIDSCGFDFYPQTSHYEMVCHLQAKKELPPINRV